MPVKFDGRLCRLHLIISEELANAIQEYFKVLIDLIDVDETHEWMKENSVFNNIQDLYSKIDEVESVMQWAEVGTVFTQETRKQFFDLLDEYYKNFVERV